MFKNYHDNLAIFHLNQVYLQGNESFLRNAIAQYKLKKEDYIYSQFSADEEYKKEIEKRKLEKEDEIKAKYNMSIHEYFARLTKKLAQSKQLLESNKQELVEAEKKVIKQTEIIWTILNSLFVVGGMLGAFGSKFVLDILGRKKGILFHNLFGIFGSVLVFLAVYVKSPVCILVGRFLLGIQGGMSCSLIPTYLSEISPADLRGQTGVIHQLFITIGILTTQTLGFRQILG